MSDEKKEQVRKQIRKSLGERNLKRLRRIEQDAENELKRIQDMIYKQEKELDELKEVDITSWINPF